MARVAASPITLVGNTIMLDSPEMLHYPHVVVTFSYFTDANGTDAPTPTAGTIAVSTKYNGSQGYIAFSGSSIDCTTEGAYADSAGPSISFKAEPTGITGATNYQMTVTGNKG